jgi:hypothetical protein
LASPRQHKPLAGGYCRGRASPRRARCRAGKRKVGMRRRYPGIYCDDGDPWQDHCKAAKGDQESIRLFCCPADRVQTIAQTYLRPSATLSENTAWLDICTLARLTLILSFSPTASLDAQLFLPELSHIITLLLGSGPLLMRQTVYGILVNVLQSLATSPASGEMDTQSWGGLDSRRIPVVWS